MIYRGPGCQYDLAPPTPPPPSPVSKLSLFLSLSVCRPSTLLTGERGSGWGRSQIIRGRRESLVLCKSFNTQVLDPYISVLKMRNILHLQELSVLHILLPEYNSFFVVCMPCSTSCGKMLGRESKSYNVRRKIFVQTAVSVHKDTQL